MTFVSEKAGGLTPQLNKFRNKKELGKNKDFRKTFLPI